MTDNVHVDLSGVPQTMLATLYGRAADADAEYPILGDSFAKDLVSRLDYDWTRTGLSARQASSLTMRSAHFDHWARQFLAAHERAVVLHLGCGLDSRVFRLNPGPGSVEVASTPRSVSGHSPVSKLVWKKVANVSKGMRSTRS